MKFVLYGIGTGLIRRLRSFRGWLSLLLIPALGYLAMVLLMGSTTSGAPSVLVDGLSVAGK